MALKAGREEHLVGEIPQAEVVDRIVAGHLPAAGFLVVRPAVAAIRPVEVPVSHVAPFRAKVLPAQMLVHRAASHAAGPSQGQAPLRDLGQEAPAG